MGKGGPTKKQEELLRKVRAANSSDIPMRTSYAPKNIGTSYKKAQETIQKLEEGYSPNRP